MKKRNFEASFETREADEGLKVIEGYFSVFGKPYHMGPGLDEYVEPTAFDGALSDDIRALCDHDTRLVLGRTKNGTLKLEVREAGLWGRILINEQDQDAVNLYNRVRRGDVSQCSFGFDILEEEYEWATEAGKPDKCKIKRVKLYEVSVCTFPAYEDTEVYARTKDAEAEKRKLVDAWREKMKARLNA